MDNQTMSDRFRFMGSYLVTLEDKNRFAMPPAVMDVMARRSGLLAKMDKNSKDRLLSESDGKKIFFWTNDAKNGIPSLNIFDAYYHDIILDGYRQRLSENKSIIPSPDLEKTRRLMMSSIDGCVPDKSRRIMLPHWMIENGTFSRGLYRMQASKDGLYFTFAPHKI